MRRPIAAILALLFVGGIIAVVVGVAGTVVSLNSDSKSTASGDSMPPGVVALPVTPGSAATPVLYAGFGPSSLQFLKDHKTGWYGAKSCTESHEGTTKCRGELYATADGGVSWQPLYRGTLEAFEFSSPTVGIGYNNASSCSKGPCRSQILESVDSGRTWTEVMHPYLGLSSLTIVSGEAWLIGNDCNGVTPAVNCSTYLVRSPDGGATWVQMSIPRLPVRLFLGTNLSRPTKDDAFTGRADSIHGRAELLTTHDGGATWSSSPMPDIFEGAELFFRTRLQGWLLVGSVPGAGGQLKTLYGTTDGGKTWTKLAKADIGTPEPGVGEFPQFGYVGPLSFVTPLIGWEQSSRLGIAKTVDGGRTWSLKYDSQSAPIYNVGFVDENHGWAIPYQGYTREPYMISTSDGGATWQRLPLPAPEQP